MKTIHLMSGIPGSGKTYFLDNFIEGKEGNIIYHRDKFRDELRAFYHTDEYFPLPPKEEYDAWISACVSVIIAHPEATDFWFDQTSLGNGAVANFYNTLAIALNNIGIDICDYLFSIEIMCTDHGTCIARNAQREGYARVPEGVLKSMAEALRPDYKVRKFLRAPRPMNTMHVCIHRIYENNRDKGEMI